MSKAPAKTQSRIPDAAVLTKAAYRAAQKLELTNSALASVLGLSEPSVSRMSRGEYELTPGTKPFECGVLFVRLYRSLDAIAGGDDNVSRAWLRNQNTVLRNAPINLIQSIIGLVNVIEYLDSRRAVV
jgi:hypothetical protein